MHCKTLDSYEHHSLLSAVQADVKHLVYDSDEAMTSWAELAHAFPNLTRIDIDDLGQVGDCNIIDEAFFSYFPNLKELRVDTDIACDLSKVELHHLASMQVMKLKRCRAVGLERLGELPQLKELVLFVNEPKVVFSLASGSALSSLSLSLGSEVNHVSLDVAVSQLAHLTVDETNKFNHSRMAGPSHFHCTALPSSLNSLDLKLHCPEGVPGRLLGDNRVMESLKLELDTPKLPDDLLGGLEEVQEFSMELRGHQGSLPDLFARLTRVKRVDLEFDNTPIPERLLPQGAVIDSLSYRNGDGRLAKANELNLPHLTSVALKGVSAKELAWLERSPQLKYVRVKPFGPFDWFPTLPCLEDLTLDSPEMSQLPQGIRGNQSIQEMAVMNIKANTISRFGDMSQMSALSKLRIHLWSRLASELPCQKDLLTLPALMRLEVDVDFGSFAPAWAKLPAQVELELDDDKLAKAWKIFKQSHLSDEETQRYLTVLKDVYKPKELPEMPANFHLVLMAAKHNRFKAQHKAWLTQVVKQSQQTHPFGSGSILFVAGRSGFKATELKAKAAEIGFTISKKWDDSVSHVLIGSAPKSVELIDFERHAIIDDSVLQQCFEAEAPKFLQQQGKEAMEASIIEMLASADEASHKVAAEMLQQGGVTEAMRLPLFLILKTTADNHFRKQLKQLLAGMGDEAFQLAVADRILFHECRGRDEYHRPNGQGVMVDKLKRQRKKWGESLCMEFAQLYFQRYGEGLIYVLMQKEPAQLRLKILESLVEGDSLNWRRGMGFDLTRELWDDKPQIDLHWNPEYYLNKDSLLGSAKTELPAEFANRYEIRQLDLGNCLLAALPKGTEQFTQICRLNLSHNRLEKLPPFLAKFNQLEELDLSYNHFKEFPGVLLKISGLKRLDLRRATKAHPDVGYGERYRQLQVPQAFYNANPDCEVLQDSDEQA